MVSPNTEAVYRFIQAYHREHGYSPTLREIAEGCYLNVATVLRHLDRLEGQGRIARDPGKARSIRLLNPVPEPPQTKFEP